MSIYTPTSETSTTAIGDLIGKGIDALKEGYTAKKTAEAKVEVTKEFSGSPYAVVVLVAVLGLVAYLVIKNA